MNSRVIMKARWNVGVVVSTAESVKKTKKSLLIYMGEKCLNRWPINFRNVTLRQVYKGKGFR